ncbi:hypothetical protein PFTANZ_06560 [Plasmodium falciparum Tanzania (2000708)]|uniref:Surface antigen n=1 Tax=Plasmodium falciparum Tanzania (2000708) TaxID=1036725 RepID=A0A024VVF2_PLAFA|nr:hypothetical protein PFTANZ_06560 [Plasmodium falciparum Tanzania (2000708)]
MKSVKGTFDRQASQRFEEYEERIKDKRQKRKEERDKNIQKIILKDKIEKSLEEKVEKGCLICGCGLGGGVAPFVGLFGGLAVNEMKKGAMAAAAEAGIDEAIKGVGSIFNLNVESNIQWTEIIHAENYNQKMSLIAIVNSLYNKCEDGQAVAGPLFCQASDAISRSGRGPEFSRTISVMAGNAAESAEKAASEKFAEMTSVGTICSNPVVISAIVVATIAVILLIIYLVLRYLNVGGGVTLSSGVLGGIGAVAVNAWKDAAIIAAKEAAIAKGAAEGAAKGLAEGMRVTIGVLKKQGVGELCPELLESIGSKIHYTDAGQISKIILQKLETYCGFDSPPNGISCMEIRIKLGMILRGNRQPPPNDIYISKMMEGIKQAKRL